jgi:hypothetical protein
MMEVDRPNSRPSSIEQLDEEVRELISELRVKRRWTIKKIRAKLLELGEDVSRSALARHTRKLDEAAERTAEKLRIARGMARVMAQSGEEAEDGQLARLNAEMFEVGIFQLLTQSLNGKPLAPDLQMKLGIALDKSTSVKARLQQIEERAEKRAAEKLMKTVEGMAKTTGSGLTREAVAAIRHAVLGTD